MSISIIWFFFSFFWRGGVGIILNPTLWISLPLFTFSRCSQLSKPLHVNRQLNVFGDRVSSFSSLLPSLSISFLFSLSSLFKCIYLRTTWLFIYEYRSRFSFLKNLPWKNIINQHLFFDLFLWNGSKRKGEKMYRGRRSRIAQWLRWWWVLASDSPGLESWS